MSDDPHGAREIPVGTPVMGSTGSLLGRVREAYPHYLLVKREGEHEDLNIPVHSILRFEGGELWVSINQESASEVDHEETAHELFKESEQG